ncbi:COPII coat assembly protein SEC16 ASCRUDRAFT_72237 [Ascoidea rubescens DSM 1968]|uniref:COPII coat assembly protein SEC16 n=1 Tax=Ascoidea rubescens DSM 1968 TaxID=1344418 RepID=A0A1D2VB30_9ASCO|nr:hypothetical protein ASCRUDRAFT_72237 [Ascoidea rubescens DSM 1968]ODV58826.1 hypothetical protein ASCRUDRAFT_72237 [Ascoidea rubescens DSM 1968]
MSPILNNQSLRASNKVNKTKSDAYDFPIDIISTAMKKQPARNFNSPAYSRSRSNTNNSNLSNFNNNNNNNTPIPIFTNKNIPMSPPSKYNTQSNFTSPKLPTQSLRKKQSFFEELPLPLPKNSFKQNSRKTSSHFNAPILSNQQQNFLPSPPSLVPQPLYQNQNQNLQFNQVPINSLDQQLLSQNLSPNPQAFSAKNSTVSNVSNNPYIPKATPNMPPSENSPNSNPYNPYNNKKINTINSNINNLNNNLGLSNSVSNPPLTNNDQNLNINFNNNNPSFQLFPNQSDQFSQPMPHIQQQQQQFAPLQNYVPNPNMMPLQQSSMQLPTITPKSTNYSSQLQNSSYNNYNQNNALLVPPFQFKSHTKANESTFSYSPIVLTEPPTNRDKISSVENQVKPSYQIPIFQWSPTDKIVKLVPVFDNYGTCNVSIEIKPVKSILKSEPLIEAFPILNVSANATRNQKLKTELMNWIQNKIKSFSLDSNCYDYVTFFNLLLLILNNNGNVNSLGFIKSVCSMFNPKVDVTFDSDISLNPNSRFANDFSRSRGSTVSTAIALNAFKLEKANNGKFLELLGKGEKSAALKLCINEKDWGLALLLANSLCPDKYQYVADQYINDIYKNKNDLDSKLISFVLHVISRSCSFQKLFEHEWQFILSHWNQILCMILANNIAYKHDFSVFFGSSFIQNDFLNIGHVVLMIFLIPISSMPLESGFTFEMIGYGGVGKDIRSIIMTEIYEFILLTSADNTFNNNYFPHLFTAKLMHAQYLADYGYFKESLKVAENLNLILKTQKYAVSQTVTVELRNLLERINETNISDETSGWFSSKFAKPKLDKMFNKFIAGDDADDTSPKEGGLFSKFNASSATILENENDYSNYGAFTGRINSVASSDNLNNYSNKLPKNSVSNSRRTSDFNPSASKRPVSLAHSDIDSSNIGPYSKTPNQLSSAASSGFNSPEHVHVQLFKTTSNRYQQKGSSRNSSVIALDALSSPGIINTKKISRPNSPPNIKRNGTPKILSSFSPQKGPGSRPPTKMNNFSSPKKSFIKASKNAGFHDSPQLTNKNNHYAPVRKAELNHISSFSKPSSNKEVSKYSNQLQVDLQNKFVASKIENQKSFSSGVATSENFSSFDIANRKTVASGSYEKLERQSFEKKIESSKSSYSPTTNNKERNASVQSSDNSFFPLIQPKNNFSQPKPLVKPKTTTEPIFNKNSPAQTIKNSNKENPYSPVRQISNTKRSVSSNKYAPTNNNVSQQQQNIVETPTEDAQPYDYYTYSGYSYGDALIKETANDKSKASPVENSGPPNHNYFAPNTPLEHNQNEIIEIKLNSEQSDKFNFRNINVVAENHSPAPPLNDLTNAGIDHNLGNDELYSNVIIMDDIVDDEEEDESSKEQNTAKIQTTGWFSNWFNGSDKEVVHKAKLGEKNNFVYDEDLKRWVDHKDLEKRKEEEARKKEAKKKEDKKKEEERRKKQETKSLGSKNSQKGGFFGWLSKREKNEPKVHVAKLGEESKFYYDEKLKRWVNKDAPQEAETAAAPPPPPIKKKTTETLEGRGKAEFSAFKSAPPPLGSSASEPAIKIGSSKEDASVPDSSTGFSLIEVASGKTIPKRRTIRKNRINSPADLSILDVALGKSLPAIGTLKSTRAARRRAARAATSSKIANTVGEEKNDGKNEAIEKDSSEHKSPALPFNIKPETSTNPSNNKPILPSPAPQNSYSYVPISSDLFSEEDFPLEDKKTSLYSITKTENISLAESYANNSYTPNSLKKSEKDSTKENVENTNIKNENIENENIENKNIENEKKQIDPNTEATTIDIDNEALKHVSGDSATVRDSNLLGSTETDVKPNPIGTLEDHTNIILESNTDEPEHREDIKNNFEGDFENEKFSISNLNSSPLKIEEDIFEFSPITGNKNDSTEFELERDTEKKLDYVEPNVVAGMESKFDELTMSNTMMDQQDNSQLAEAGVKEDLQLNLPSPPKSSPPLSPPMSNNSSSPLPRLSSPPILSPDSPSGPQLGPPPPTFRNRAAKRREGRKKPHATPDFTQLMSEGRDKLI